jgi:hypothetical protein
MAAPPGARQRSSGKFIVFENFEKVNTQDLRQGLAEKQLALAENLQPLAGNNWTTVPAPLSPALGTILETAQSMFYADIAGTDYLIVFTTAGAAFAVNAATGFFNQFANDGTFGSAPDMTVWTASRVLINDSVAGYCTFDGTVFTKQGGVSPVIAVTSGGAGYASAPAVTISGGSGTGATAHSVVVNGSVVSVVLDNQGNGYRAGDTLTVTIAAGSAGSGATGHVTMTGFPVANVTIANPGQFISALAGTYALNFSGGGGSGAAGTATLIVIGGFAYCVSVSLTSGGSGYTTTPTCTITPPGAPNAAFNVFLGTQAVATIVLDTAGSGYGAPPAVTITGGGGSGATAHSTISGGAVNALILDTAGSGFTSTPSVVIAGGASTATATAHIWPFVPKGTTIAVFAGRVWLAGGQLLQYTGTQGFDDFAAGNASGSLTISDADLVHAITALRNYNNYLYIFGDQSVKQIGNISLNGAGNVTLFTILTLSSDQGTIYPRSCFSYNRVSGFVNNNGVYAILGSSVQKISGDMDGIFKLIDFTQQPQAAIIDINNIHNVGFLVRYKDPLETTRSLILVFDGKRWYPTSQGDSLVTLATAPILATGTTKTFGSSGTDITQIFADPTVAVEFLAQTSLTHHGNAVQRKKIDHAGCAVTGPAGGGSLTIAVDTDNGSQTYTKTIVAGFQFIGFTADGSGEYLGMTLSGTLKNFTLSMAGLEYQEISRPFSK